MKNYEFLPQILQVLSENRLRLAQIVRSKRKTRCTGSEIAKSKIARSKQKLRATDAQIGRYALKKQTTGAKIARI